MRDEEDQDELERVRKIYHKNLSKIWENNHKLIGRNQENLDKQLIALSTGVLAVSIGFFTHSPTLFTHYLWLIILSWWLLGGATLMTLFSFCLSSRALSNQSSSIEDVLHGDAPFYRHDEIKSSWTYRLLKLANWGSPQLIIK